MTYNDTPLSNQKQDVSQPLIRANFQQLQNTIGTDHFGPNDLTVNNGYHKPIHTPNNGSIPNSSATYDVFYAYEQTSPLGILQFSRGWDQVNAVPAVPSPVTYLQSQATGITLPSSNPGGTTNVLDFTGITLAMFQLVAMSTMAPFNAGSQLVCDGIWNGTNFVFQTSSTVMKVTNTGNILQIQAPILTAITGVYWTLQLFRTQ